MTSDDDVLPPLPYETRRRMSLERCLKFRAFIRNPETIAPGYGAEHAQHALHSEHTLMLKLRQWRRTGIWPSDN